MGAGWASGGDAGRCLSMPSIQKDTFELYGHAFYFYYFGNLMGGWRAMWFGNYGFSFRCNRNERWENMVFSTKFVFDFGELTGARTVRVCLRCAFYLCFVKRFVGSAIYFPVEGNKTQCRNLYISAISYKFDINNYNVLSNIRTHCIPR